MSVAVAYVMNHVMSGARMVQLQAALCPLSEQSGPAWAGLSKRFGCLFEAASRDSKSVAVLTILSETTANAFG
jgi:hypothetical protein